MHLEIMDTVGKLCDPSYGYRKGFEIPLQPVWAILAVFYLIFCAENGHKNQDLVGKLGRLLV